MLALLALPGLPALLAAAWHLGTLHGYERLLVAVIAVGPFVVLGVVVYVARRRDVAADRERQVADGRRHTEHRG